MSSPASYRSRRQSGLHATQGQKSDSRAYVAAVFIARLRHKYANRAGNSWFPVTRRID